MFLLESLRTQACVSKKTSAPQLNFVPGELLKPEFVIADEVSTHYEVWVRIRALFTTLAYVCGDILGFPCLIARTSATPSWASFMLAQVPGCLSPTTPWHMRQRCSGCLSRCRMKAARCMSLPRRRVSGHTSGQLQLHASQAPRIAVFLRQLVLRPCPEKLLLNWLQCAHWRAAFSASGTSKDTSKCSAIAVNAPPSHVAQRKQTKAMAKAILAITMMVVLTTSARAIDSVGTTMSCEGRNF